jgi:hypothetical protein
VVGQRRERSLLESTSTYEIVAVETDLVRVRVVEVPGLAPGTQLWLTVDAVLAMKPATTPPNRISAGAAAGQLDTTMSCPQGALRDGRRR